MNDNRQQDEAAGSGREAAGGVASGPLVYDRREGRFFHEVVLGGRWLRLAYRGALRGLSRRLLFRHALVSRLFGWYADSRLSRSRIRPAIAELGIDESEFREPVESFRTFNDFFCRHLRPGVRPFDPSPEALCSPADCRLLAFQVLAGQRCVPVKGSAFTLGELMGPGRAEEATRFAGGSVAVLRLCPADYHRFHYAASGSERSHWEVPGLFHSVNPMVLAMGVKVFVENRRLVNVLHFDHFGDVLWIEVGAFAVAAIEQTHARGRFEKMEEKGLFRFGGSTLVLAFSPGAVSFDHDLCERSREGVETRVRCGETIGQAARPNQP